MSYRVQDNLLNAESLNAGTLTVVDIHTGEVLKKPDLPAEYNPWRLICPFISALL